MRSAIICMQTKYENINFKLFTRQLLASKKVGQGLKDERKLNSININIHKNLRNILLEIFFILRLG